MTLKDYARLVKFRYHISFLEVVIPAIFFTGGISIPLIEKIALLYVTLNLFLYTGLYTLNDIGDLKSDRSHPIKKNRPIASGKVSVKSGLAFALGSIALGMATGYILFGHIVLLLYAVFVCLNVFYTFYAKHVPYLDLVANSLTHPLRALLALQVIGYTSIPYLMLACNFLFMIGAMSIRRVVEKDIDGWEARKVLQSYKNSSLIILKTFILAAMIALFALDKFKYAPIYLTMIVIFTVFAIGIHVFPQVRKLSRSMATK